MEGGEEEDDVVAAVFPDVEEDQNGEGVGGKEPVDGRDMEKAEEIVDEAALVKDDLEEEDDGGDGKDEGEDKGSAKELVPAELTVEEKGDEEGHDHDERDGDEDEAQGVPGGQLEGGVAQHIGVVGKTDESRTVKAGGHGDIDAEEEGEEEEESHAENGGQGEEEAGPGLLSL